MALRFPVRSHAGREIWVAVDESCGGLGIGGTTTEGGLQCDVHGSIVDRLQGLDVRVARANVSDCIDDGLMISLRLVIIEGHVTDTDREQN
jgi:hypothetical protein